MSSHWQEVALGDICQIQIGGTPSRSEDAYWWKSNEDGERLPWVSISDLQERVITRTKEGITRLGLERSNAKRVPQGTLLMSFKLTIGKLAFAGRDLYTNEAIASLRTSDSVYPEFLYYGLQYWDLTANTDQAVKGVTLNKQKLQEIPCLLPPLPEQKKIAEILSGIDKVLLAYEKQVHKLSMSLIALRNNFITSNTSAQWAVVEDLCTAQAGGTPDRSRSEYYCGPIPWVKSGEVRGEDILQTEETITREAITNSSAKIVPAGSILVAMYGATAGQTAQLKIQAATNQAVLALNARSSKINNRYILFAISAFKDFLLMTCQGSGQPNLSAELIKNLAIPVPDLEYQNKMVMMLDAVLRRITYLRAKLSSTRSLKQAISSDLLSGRKRVTIQP